MKLPLHCHFIAIKHRYRQIFDIQEQRTALIKAAGQFFKT
jgi:hypothetical protein